MGNGSTVFTETITKLYHANLGSMRRLIAVRKGSQLTYIGCDHLGSTIKVVDPTFAGSEQQRYTPWGANRVTNLYPTTDHGFTGQVEDASIGLQWTSSPTYTLSWKGRSK